MVMNKQRLLPLLEPIYSTYHVQSIGYAVAASNPSIRNWYLNEVLSLTCRQRFLNGYTTPDVRIDKSPWLENPYLEKRWIEMRILGRAINEVIKNMLDMGYYVYFGDVDDFYIQGKSWYHKRHFTHDGLICGYNREDKTYCIYAYDSNWMCRSFFTPQAGLDRGRKAMEKQGIYGHMCGIKPYEDTILFSAEQALKNINEYISSDLSMYPMTGENMAYGIVVHIYMAKYVDMLYDGLIPYERMDWRIFRVLWEQKKFMQERIQRIEKAFDLSDDISSRYGHLVSEADSMRMLYAAHHMRRRDSVLPGISKKLLLVHDKEKELLGGLLRKAGVV